MRRFWSASLLGVLALAGAIAVAAPVPVLTEPFKDRKEILPFRKFEPLPGRVVGVMVAGVADVMGHDGRSGPPDAMAFSRNAGSYRWVYTPADQNPIITQLQVKVGEMGDKVKIYPKLNMANAANVAQWKVTAPVSLVEVEVNDNLGAPADEGFVGTSMRRLDGTKDYPLDSARVFETLKKAYAEHQKNSQPAISKALEAAQARWLKEAKPTGPRESKEVVFLTWMAEKELFRVHFRTKISDGAYNFVEGGAGGIDRPFPLPPPPLPPNPGGKPGGQQPGFAAAFPPPPPRFERVRVGSTFGLEYGMVYEVSKDGDVVRQLELVPEGFGEQLPVPPGVGGFPRDGGPALPPRP